MNTFMLALVIIVVAAIVSVIGIYVVRRNVKSEAVVRHQRIADPLLNVVATLYAVLLGFVVAAAMDRYEKARDIVDAEATCVHTIYQLSKGLPEEERQLIWHSCTAYCRSVVDDEWPAMEKDNTSNKTREIYSELWDAVMTFTPENDREVCADEGLVASMQQLAENRSNRIVTMKKGVSPATWLFVWGGAAITMIFTYLLAARASALQFIMTMLVAISIGLNMVLLFVIAKPFSGEFKVQATAFEINLQNFSHEILRPLKFKLKGQKKDLEDNLIKDHK